MIGNSWWSDVTRHGEEPKLCPPRVVVSISGEPAPQEGSIEWTSATGKAFDVSDPPTGTTYIGRCVGKQLFISDVDEKKKKVEALVKIMAQSSDDEPERIIGTFPSRPIKVISKPSKKRQSAKNLECESACGGQWHIVTMSRPQRLCGRTGQQLTIDASRRYCSVYQSRFDHIALPPAAITDRLDQVPLRVGIWLFVQGIRRRASHGARSALPNANAIVHRPYGELGCVRVRAMFTSFQIDITW